jgi:TonB family protein
MGFRFNRRIRILPGLRLNFSKGGVSMSIGGRGAWLTFGKRGVGTTVGIPGTGLSDTSTSGTHCHGAPQADSEQPTPPGSAVRGWLWLALIVAVVAMVAASAAHADEVTALTETTPPASMPSHGEEQPLEHPSVYTKENTPDCRPPYYPKEARRAGVEGTTVLLVLVDARGRASQIKIESSSGSEFLDIRAAGCMIRQGKFKPATTNGQPVETWQRIKWNWKLAP